MAKIKKLLIKQTNILQFIDWTLFQMSVISLGSGVEDRTSDFMEHCSKCSYFTNKWYRLWNKQHTTQTLSHYSKKIKSIWLRLQSPARHLVQQPSKYCQVAWHKEKLETAHYLLYRLVSTDLCPTLFIVWRHLWTCFIRCVSYRVCVLFNHLKGKLLKNG